MERLNDRRTMPNQYPPPNSVDGGYLELFKLRAGLITITESCEKIVRYIYLQIVTLSTGSVNK